MTDDARSKLRELLGKAPAGQLAGKAPRQLSAAEMGEKFKPVEQQGNVRVIYVTDATVSMSPYIQAVQDRIREVGSHVLSASLGIEGAAMAFDEHIGGHFGYNPKALKVSQRDSRIRLHDNFLQTNSFTTDPLVLEEQVRQLVRADEGNGTADEPYECAAKYVVDLMNNDRATNLSRRYCVVLFGDDAPHGVEIAGNQACPNGVSPLELRTMASVANSTFFVDCDEKYGDSPFKLCTYEQARGIESARYVRFRDAAPVLKEALIGMAEQARGARAYAEYLNNLPAITAGKVAGLLGEPKK